MQYLLSFYAVSSVGANQLYWHRYLASPGGPQGWGPTAVGSHPKRIAFSCAGTESGELDCGNDPAVALGSGEGRAEIYWLFQGANNVFGDVEDDSDSETSTPADLYVGGLQIEPTVTEKRGVLVMGDSLTQYNCSDDDSVDCTSWTEGASSQLDVPFYNRGVGGQTCASIRSRWSRDASPILAANAGYVIIQCGTNDIGVPLNAGQIEQSISAMYGLATGDGATPVVVTIGPFRTTAAVDGAEAIRQAVNAWIRSTFPFVLDFDKVNADPNNPRQQNQAYFGDGTHLNLAGRIAEGNYVAQSIEGNNAGYPSIWNFHSPIAYQPILGSNPSNGMDFSSDSQREVGTYIIIPSAGTLSSAKYKFAFSSATLSVTPAPLTVAANNKTMTSGDPVPALDGALSGAFAADNISATYSTSVTSTSIPGTYPIVPRLVDPKKRLSNYSVTQQAGTLTILAAPAINSLSPPFAAAGGAGFNLIVNGSNFVSDDVVHWAGAALVTQFVSSTRLSAQVPASDLAKAGTAKVNILNSATGGGASSAFEFEIDSSAVPSDAPAIGNPTASISPGSAATYAVTLPSAATQVSALCLNLPVSSTCSYSAVTKAVTISTASSTAAGNYQIVVVFTESLPGTAPGLASLPVLFFAFSRARKRRRTRTLLSYFLLLVMMGAISSCGAAGPPRDPIATAPQTHQVTSSAAVTLVVQ